MARKWLALSPKAGRKPDAMLQAGRQVRRPLRVLGRELPGRSAQHYRTLAPVVPGPRSGTRNLAVPVRPRLRLVVAAGGGVRSRRAAWRFRLSAALRPEQRTLSPSSWRRPGPRRDAVSKRPVPSPRVFRRRSTSRSSCIAVGSGSGLCRDDAGRDGARLIGHNVTAKGDLISPSFRGRAAEPGTSRSAAASSARGARRRGSGSPLRCGRNDGEGGWPDDPFGGGSPGRSAQRS